MSTEPMLPKAIAAQRIAQFDQMSQSCTELKILVCRLCGTNCRIVRIGEDPRPSRGCVITAEYASGYDPCPECRNFSTYSDGVEDSAGAVREAAWSWGRDVAQFQASVAEARVAEVEERLASLEQTIHAILPYIDMPEK